MCFCLILSAEPKLIGLFTQHRASCDLTAHSSLTEYCLKAVVLLCLKTVEDVDCGFPLMISIDRFTLS